MSIACPSCSHRIALRAAKPGRFRPTCPSCGKPFVLVVPPGPDGSVEVRPAPADTMVGGKSSGTLPPRARPPVTHPPSAPVVVADSSSGSHLFNPAVAIPDTPPPAQELSGVSSGAAAAGPLPDAQLIPPRTHIRGYEIERELGRGGMGFVYLARQVSLDRPVALKVMSKRWATDPVFVARFTREAYAAAQLSHPNIVHIHDIGEAHGTRFFSMEYVRGRSLADLVKAQGKLDHETAVAYVLQAARGLKHAHDRGMIHRDVKPDNLLLDDQGLVKVADLGLVKTTDTRRADDALSGPRSGLDALPPDMTGARIALGTPAYMSPEQCRDAATVDHRADVYSLGCTLYVLVTGRPPFDGTTAVELMSKHAYDPLVPPEQIVARVPKELSAIIQRMMAKNREDRYASMGEVIRVLEHWLGVHHAGTFSPQEEQISLLEGYVHQFNAAPAAVLRRRVVRGFFATLALAAVLITFFGKGAWAVGLVGLGVQAALAYFVLEGVARRGPLFRRARQFLFGLTWGDWAVALAGLALFVILLAMFRVMWVWAGFGLIGAGLAFALRHGPDRAVAAQRRAVLEGCERLLRRLRAQGLDEEEIRQFVAKFAGRDWEEFFEALFGYEEKLAARGVLLRGGMAGVREKHAGWREPLIALMDRVEKARREARERKLLLAVERAQLLAAGETPSTAENRAQVAAEAMVRAAGEVREAERQAAPVNFRRAVAAAEESPFAFVPTPKRDPLAGLVGLFVGPHVRAVFGAVLLAACALWVHQNGIIAGTRLRAEAVQAAETRDLTALQQTAARGLAKPTRPLLIAGVPPAATGWVDGWNVGFAGLLLLGSLVFRGNLMAVFVLLGAGVAAVGHQYGIRTVEPFRADHVALMLGAVLALVGFRVAR